MGEGGTGFQVFGMIEWEQNQNPKKSLGLPTKIKKIPGPKINPKKSHAEFPSLQNFEKGLNDAKKQPPKTFGCSLFTELRGQDVQALPRIFRLFCIPKNPFQTC